MSRDPAPTAPLTRCLAVWLAVTLAVATLLQALAPALGHRLTTGPSGVPFDALLVDASVAVLAGCAAWFWLGATAVVVEVAGGGRLRPAPGTPRRLRAALLAACGVTVLLGAPAQADPAVGLPPTAPGDDGRVVEGLRLPERPSVPAAPALLVVRPGDSLWGIAERLLPAGASDADVDRRWRSLYRHNREVVGPDPDHIEPRMTLHVPKEY